MEIKMSYLDEISEIWNLAFKNISAEKTYSFANLWFKDLNILSYSDNTIIFSTNSQFKYDMIKKNHLGLLKDALSNYLPCEVDIVFEGEKTDVETIKEQIYKEEKADEPQKKEKEEVVEITPDEGFYKIHNP